MFRPTLIKSIILSAIIGGLLPSAIANSISEKFSASSETSEHRVDYRPIGQFTDAFCTETSRRTACAFDAIGQQGREYLTRYSAYLQQIPVSELDENDQLAFWLNTRNVLILHAIAEANNKRSLRSARGTFEAPGEMWTEKRITIEGVELSIDDIERYILLANFDTPNIIYGLYQGTKGGPPLAPSGFTGETVLDDLEQMGQAFVDSRTGVRVRRNRVDISAIYDWYSEALFGGDEASLRDHLISLSSDNPAEALAGDTALQTTRFNYSTDNHVIRQQSPAARTGGSFGGGATGGS